MMQPFDRTKARRQIAAICRKAVKPFGYEGKGVTWKKIEDTSALMIDLQTSRNDDLSHLTFTFKLGSRLVIKVQFVRQAVPDESRRMILFAVVGQAVPDGDRRMVAFGTECNVVVVGQSVVVGLCLT